MADIKEESMSEAADVEKETENSEPSKEDGKTEPLTKDEDKQSESSTKEDVKPDPSSNDKSEPSTKEGNDKSEPSTKEGDDKSEPSTKEEDKPEEKTDSGAEQKSDEKAATATTTNTEENESDTVQKVAKRLRFFFSDANLRQDRFLRRELENSENNGYVSFSTLLRFNSIRQHTSDVSVILKAVRHELLSDRLKVKSDETGVGRIVPFDNAKLSDNIKTSLHVDNLPMETKKEVIKKDDGTEKTVERNVRFSTSYEEITKMFEPWGEVILVKLLWKKPPIARGARRYDDEQQNKVPDDTKDKHHHHRPYENFVSEPLGTCLVEYQTVEELTNAAADLCSEEEGKEPKKTLTIADNTLKIQTMKKWVDDKEERKKERMSGRKRHREERDDDNNNNNNKNYQKARGGNNKTDKKAEDDKDDKKEDVFEFKLDWKKGCVISLSGLSDSSSREDILKTISDAMAFPVQDVKKNGIYADYSRGQTNGAIRFREPNEKIAEIVSKLSDGSLTIADAKVEKARILEGEEEEKYYADFIAFKNKQIRARNEENNNYARNKKRFKKGGHSRRRRW